jgi:hypothetical protein
MRQSWADAASADAGQENGSDEAIDGTRAAMVARYDGRGEALEAAAGHVQIRDGAPRGGDAPPVGAIPDVAAACGTDVARGLEVGREFVVQPIVQEEFEGAFHLDGEITPEAVRVLDLLPQVR